MKCYTVTKDGVVSGIQFLHEPYPHVAVGDPALSSADCRRVEVDAALAGGATDEAPAVRERKGVKRQIVESTTSRRGAACFEFDQCQIVIIAGGNDQFVGGTPVLRAF